MANIHTINIPCPVCQTPIPAETRSLILGMQFSCPQCAALIGMQPQSVDTAQTAINKFEKIQTKMSKMAR